MSAKTTIEIATPGHMLGAERAYPMFSSAPAHPGVTKRELIAIAALQGILTGDPNCDADAAARDAVEYADALLARLAA